MLSAIARFINEWRATAAIYADPQLLAILTDTEGVDDFGRVKPPEAPGCRSEMSG